MHLDFPEASLQLLIGFFLIMTRVLAMLMVAPVISRREIPQIVKIGTAGALTMIFYEQILAQSQNLISLNPWALSMHIVYEIIIGALFGFVINLIFDALVTYAQIVGIQMGGSAANVFDPSTNSSASPIALFYLYASLTIFLLLNGFYNMIEILLKSFEILPLGLLELNYEALGQNFIPIFNTIFVVALKFLLPVLSVMLIIDVFVAITAKILPQANIYFLIMPSKLILGMIVISLTIAGLQSNIDEYFSETLAKLIEQLFS